MSILNLGLPDPAPVSDLPKKVTIWEMGVRDGLQSDSHMLTVTDKVDLVHRLSGAGLPVIEAGSFVRPDRVPQMANTPDVYRTVGTTKARLPALVPNLRGLDDALASGVREIAVFLSVTESFSLANLSASRGKAEIQARQVVSRAVEHGLHVRGYLSMVFGDPWEGAVKLDEIRRLTGDLLSWGVTEVSLGDTIGVATPGLVQRVLQALQDDGVNPSQIALHMHDTYGQALANVFAGLQCGVTTFDSSVAGLGGCPFARTATGNLATEDLVWMLQGLGIKTGIDLTALVEIASWLNGLLHRTTTSRVMAAITGETKYE